MISGLYRKLRRKNMSFPQRCKVCGGVDRIDFKVSGNLWEKVVLQESRGTLIGLSGFDYFASAKNVAVELDQKI